MHETSRCIDTRGKGIKRAVPEHFPYFHVEFGADGGYVRATTAANSESGRVSGGGGGGGGKKKIMCVF
eukprot:SAG11_NODE_5102_length_1664_cov_2.469649_1_plen_67_part_10